MSKHIWVVEYNGKNGWKDHEDENRHCKYWRDKASAEYAMNHMHNGHLKNLRVSKYVVQK